MTVVCSRPLLWASMAALLLGSFLFVCYDYLNSHSSRGGVWEWEERGGVLDSTENEYPSSVQFFLWSACANTSCASSQLLFVSPMFRQFFCLCPPTHPQTG